MTRLSRITRDGHILILVGLIVLAFLLRWILLDSVPPGWRDDELINSLVISQKFLDGDWQVYYADASGHEALYHFLNAAMLALFGPGAAGIRLLSALLGTLTVPLTYLVANRLYGWKVGLAAAAGLTLSFWSLMYSRIGIRHVSLPVFMLATFFFFLRGMGIGHRDDQEIEQESSSTSKFFILAGLMMGLGFYTYFASRGVPLILLFVIVYIWLFHRSMLSGRWKGIALMIGVALLLALPLILTLLQQPESEARVGELAVPLVAARAGNFSPLGEHIARTLAMYHGDGDEEWLYNIPHRPVFGPVLALFFWLGVALASWYALKPFIRFGRSLLKRAISSAGSPRYEIAGAFLLIWWLVGIIPAFVSVPPASLGHTIIAQSAVYILVALPVFGLEKLSQQSVSQARSQKPLTVLPFIFILLLIIGTAWRDLPDYFLEWPNRGMTRFLYRAEISEIAEYLGEHPDITDFGVTGLLAGPWDKLALAIEAGNESQIKPRWFNPNRVTLLRVKGEPALVFSGYPESPTLDESLYRVIPGEKAGAFDLTMVEAMDDLTGEKSCFQNGLCLLAATYEPASGALDLFWDVESVPDIPAEPLISNPPPPGVYAGPRLLVFSHLLDQEGHVLAGDDGLWIDATTLEPGDSFRQRHWLLAREKGEAAVISFGLYDPMTYERLLTTDERDHLTLQLFNH